jgi:hypothetical protein
MGTRWGENKPEDHVRYARIDLMGMVREDLLFDMARHVDSTVHQFEEWGLPIMKDPKTGRYLREGRWQIMIHGESYKPIVAEAAKKSADKVFNRICVTHLLMDDGKENRVAGAVGFNVRTGNYHVFKAKTVICGAGGASNIFKPRSVGEGSGRTWYAPWSSASAYGLMINAGAKMTQMENRIVLARFKDGYGPVGAYFLHLKTYTQNGLGEEYESKWFPELQKMVGKEYLDPEASHLCGRDVHIVGAGEVRKIGAPQEAMPLAHEFECAVGVERFATCEQGALDLLAVPFDFAPIAAPNRELAPHLARRGVRLQATPLADVTLVYFNMEHPVVGGYAPEKVALRRAVSLAFDSGRYIREIYRGSAVAAESPIVPGTFGYDPAFRTELSEYSPARAKALLDVYGYVDRNGDGWREQPDGSPLVLEMAASTSQLERRQNEQWRRCMDAVGLKMEFRIAQWPELLKQSLAGKLMMWGFAWQAGQPDSDLFFSLAYGPNLGSSNDARFGLKAYDALYAQQRRLPDGPERLALLREASRLLVAYMPYKFIAHRIQLDLSQPWVLGFRRPLFTTRLWAYLDIDAAASRG